MQEVFNVFVEGYIHKHITLGDIKSTSVGKHPDSSAKYASTNVLGEMLWKIIYRTNIIKTILDSVKLSTIFSITD